MIIFEGKYHWDGTKKGDSNPISWWPGTYRLKIVDLTVKHPEVIHIKPYLCLFSCADSDYCVKNKFHNLAVKISNEFHLNPEKVLWIENFSTARHNNLDVAIIELVTTIGGEKIYKTIWRQIRPNEKELIKSYDLFEQ